MGVNDFEEVNHTSDSEQKVYVVEVIRRKSIPVEIDGSVSGIEVTKGFDSISNVGAGSTFPANPYEGQIWIKL